MDLFFFHGARLGSSPGWKVNVKLEVYWTTCSVIFTQLACTVCDGLVETARIIPHAILSRLSTTVEALALYPFVPDMTCFRNKGDLVARSFGLLLMYQVHPASMTASPLGGFANAAETACDAA